MIDNNLSTRPFYNERRVQLGLTIIALLAVFATALNVSRVLYYSRSDTALKAQASREEAQAVEYRRAAAELRASVDARQLDATSTEARQANALIDRRVFSWTELFNHFEATLPPEVRLTSVSPRVNEDGRFMITVTVLARSIDDVAEFLENLEGAGVFQRPLTRQERINDAGQLEAVIEAEYQVASGARL
jgi:hypothetical protein